MIVFYDCFMVPFKNTFGSHTFGERSTLVLNIVDNSIKCIFALDIILCFRKSYLHERSSKEIRDSKMIAMNYLKFYFWIDLLSAIPFDLIVDNSFLRLVSLVKMFRLLRLSKIVSYLNITTATRAKIRIIYLAITLIICIHWVACYYYSIAHNGFLRKNPIFDYKYWIPSADLAALETKFY